MRAILMGMVLAAAACTPSTPTQDKSTPLPVLLVVPERVELHAATPKHTKKDESSITQQLNVLQGQLDWVSKRLPKEKE
jgi:hypothetical protein